MHFLSENSSGQLPELLMENISKRFGATVALEDVSLSVKGGEVLALVGENGAGKSTLMKILSGVYRPDSGSIRLNGSEFIPENPIQARKAGIAMIYQELSLAPHLTVKENILLGMEPSKFGFINWREVREKALQALAFFNHPEITPEIQVGKLSPAAQQLVEIARALAVGCSILVLDEPTSSLTGRDVKRLFELIHSLKSRGLAIIYISHFLEEVKAVSDRIVVLRDGKVVGAGLTKDMDVNRIVSLMVGRQIEELYPRSVRKTGELLLEIKELDGVVKPSGASIQVHRGEVVGIAGLMGAGRTELLRCIFGLDKVKSGEIKIGTYIGPASPTQRWMQGVGFLSEDRKQEGLALSMGIAENITITKLDKYKLFGFLSPKRQSEAARKWIEELKIRCAGPWQSVIELSGGTQQKVALARLLNHDVDLLLLDEPTRGIDVAAKAAIYKLIDQLATGEFGGRPRAILMVSSYLPELLGVCDRIAVMRKGYLSEAKPVSEVNEHSLMLEATTGYDTQET
ncbi:MAG: sugar ABC transporter ATP-binding protein [Limisphaerales bacterium]|jgi:ribose transport system ATP-binding protein